MNRLETILESLIVVIFSDFKKNSPVSKIPDANDRTVMDFENFDVKNFIFFDFLQIVPDAI